MCRAASAATPSSCNDACTSYPTPPGPAPRPVALALEGVGRGCNALRTGRCSKVAPRGLSASPTACLEFAPCAASQSHPLNPRYFLPAQARLQVSLLRLLSHWLSGCPRAAAELMGGGGSKQGLGAANLFLLDVATVRVKGARRNGVQ